MEVLSLKPASPVYLIVTKGVLDVYVMSLVMFCENTKIIHFPYWNAENKFLLFKRRF